jgi:hypothetical protein
MAPYFIDFEAFQHGEEDFSIKELVILNADQSLAPLCFLFKPTCSWMDLNADKRKTYNYQQRKLHHLSWNDGDDMYCRKCVLNRIHATFPLAKKSVFYVMGSEKTRFLKSEFPQLNITEYFVVMKNLPRVPINITCFCGEHGDHCALLKTYRLLQHFTALPYT